MLLTADHSLLTTYCFPLTAHYSLPTAHSLLHRATHYSLPTICCLVLLTTCYPLPTICCLVLLTTCYSLPTTTTYYLLPAHDCLLFSNEYFLLLPTPYLPLPTHSLLAIRPSLLTTYYSLPTTPHSSLLTPRSTLPTPHSPLLTSLPTLHSPLPTLPAGVAPLVKQLRNKSEVVQADSLRVLQLISKEAAGQAAVGAAGAAPTLVKLIEGSGSAVEVAATHILCNLAKRLGEASHPISPYLFAEIRCIE